MARPGGPKRGAGPNQYERKAACECDRPIPQSEVGGVSCVKCGLMLLGTLQPVTSRQGRHPSVHTGT